MLLREMGKLVGEEAPGPHPSFALVHALYALFVLDERQVGRQKLASTLSIGEGSVRTLLRKLTRRGLVLTERSGCRLTSKGERLLKEAAASLYLFELKKGSLPGKAAFGVGVRGGGRLAHGIQERDEAIKAGAEGAITLVCRGGELYMPGLVNISKEHPELSRRVLEVVSPAEGDAVILSWGRTRPGVIYGSLGAAWGLLERASLK